MAKILSFVVLCIVLTFGGIRRDGKLTANLSSAVKGIASLLIVLTHCISKSGIENGIVGSLSTGWLTVALFFFLSGYGSAYGLCRKEGYMDHFLRNRFVRVCVPLVLAYLVYAGYRLLMYGQFILDTPQKIILGTATVPYSWYPIVALCFYAFIRISFRLSDRNGMRLIMLSMLVVGMTFLMSMFIGSGQDYWYLSNFSFVFGAALSMFDPQLRFRKYVLTAAAVCAAGGFLLLPVCNRLLGEYSETVYMLSCNFGSGFLVTAVVLLLTMTGKSNKTTLFLGKISYEIYLYHGLFIQIMADVFHLRSWWALFLCTTASTIAFSVLMHIPDSFLCGKLCKRTETETNPKPEPVDSPKSV